MQFGTSCISCNMRQVCWNPWQHGHARLSEISIEQLFGRLRRKQSNAQLSATEFWAQSQFEMLQASKRCLESDGKAVKVQEEPPLTERKFLNSQLRQVFFFNPQNGSFNRFSFLASTCGTLMLVGSIQEPLCRGLLIAASELLIQHCCLLHGPEAFRNRLSETTTSKPARLGGLIRTTAMLWSLMTRILRERRMQPLGRCSSPNLKHLKANIVL